MSCFAWICGRGQLGLTMPKKLIYFEVLTPVGMPCQCALEISGKPCAGESVKFEDWGKLKPDTPTKQLPYVVMPDGKTTLAESGAVGRTIAGAAGLLGHGKDYMMSEMLLGMTADFNKSAEDIAPTIFNVDKFLAQQKQEHLHGRDEVIAYLHKYESHLLAEGDRFTKSGQTYGEIDLFCKLYCHASGAYPEVKEGALLKFYNRMLVLPGIKLVLDGKSRFGKMQNYLIPLKE